MALSTLQPLVPWDYPEHSCHLGLELASLAGEYFYMIMLVNVFFFGIQISVRVKALSTDFGDPALLDRAGLRYF